MAFIWTRMWQLGEGTPTLGGEHVNEKNMKKNTTHPRKKKKHALTFSGKKTNTTSNQLTEVQILDWPDGVMKRLWVGSSNPENVSNSVFEKIKMMVISAGQGYLI